MIGALINCRHRYTKQRVCIHHYDVCICSVYIVSFVLKCKHGKPDVL